MKMTFLSGGLNYIGLTREGCYGVQWTAHEKESIDLDKLR